MIDYEVVLLLGAIAMIIFLAFAIKNKMKHKNIATGFAFIIYITAVIAVTIFPIVYSDNVTYYGDVGVSWYNFVPFKHISELFIFGIDGYSTYQIIGNIIMTIPYGIFVMILLKKKRWWLLLIFALSFTILIELTQFTIGLLINNMYRMLDIDDVILNVSGTYLGYYLYKIYNTKIKQYLKGDFS